MMRISTLALVAMAFVFTTATAGAACLDISGTYASPFDTEDATTSYIITQQSCDYITVNSVYIKGGVSQSAASFRLDGTPAIRCLIDFFNDCGSLKVVDDGIERTSPRNTIAGDDVHGLCQFTSTLLTKDAQGNLVETVKSAKCEDNYEGPLVKQLIYQKKN